MPKIGIISQARMTSTRLPGKVLKEAAGKTLLQHHLERLQWSGLPVIVATTTNQTDEPIVLLCGKLGIPVERGDEHDVLDRYYQAARAHKLDHVIRATSDCPLIDGNLIRESASSYLQQKGETYLSNGEIRTYPRGLDFEIFSFSMLEKAWKESSDQQDREHVTPFVRRAIPAENHLHAKDPEDFSSWRLTVDQQDDYELIRRLMNEFGAAKMAYTDLKKVLVAHPELREINVHVEQKKVSS